MQLRDEAELRERFRAIQRRYQEVAPRGFYSAPVVGHSAIEKLPEPELRARTEVLACEFFRLCMLSVCREDIRAKASHRVWLAMGLFIALYFSLLFSVHKFQTISAILASGAMGGFISAQRRIQSVTDHGESLVGLIELSSLSRYLGTLWHHFQAQFFRWFCTLSLPATYSAASFFQKSPVLLMGKEYSPSCFAPLVGQQNLLMQRS